MLLLIYITLQRENTGVSKNEKSLIGKTEIWKNIYTLHYNGKYRIKHLKFISETEFYWEGEYYVKVLPVMKSLKHKIKGLLHTTTQILR